MINLTSLSLLKANLLQANRARRLCGRARSVALLVSLFMGIGLSNADSNSIDSINPKSYIRLHYSSKEALCLIKLYGKESAFKTDAIGNLNGSKQTYGIPQLKNPIIRHLSANSQIDYGMKYIAHRSQYKGSPCKAWAHWLAKGWH